MLSHNQLCLNLADSRKFDSGLKYSGTNRICFVEVKLNEDSIIDVVQIRASFSKFKLTFYEIKTSRQDFLQDINKGKYRKYLPFCNDLYFATEKDLVQPHEVPNDVGLIVKTSKGWKITKAAPYHDCKKDPDFFIRMLFSCGVDNYGIRDLRLKIGWDEWKDVEKTAKKVGRIVSRELSRIDIEKEYIGRNSKELEEEQFKWYKIKDEITSILRKLDVDYYSKTTEEILLSLQSLSKEDIIKSLGFSMKNHCENVVEKLNDFIKLIDQSSQLFGDKNERK